jgi:hypothetical protein
MISNGDTLFLVYESFFQKRYHLMVRMLEDSHHRFSEAVEIGFDTLNDLSPSLWCQDGEIYVSWENSSPLYTDYVWKNHKGTDVTMPAFGHGWQVLCKMGFRKLGFDGETLTISSLDTDWNAELELNNAESAGEPVVFMVGEFTYLAYVTKAEQSHYWKLVIQALNGSMWEFIEIPEILFDYRQKPVLVVSGNRIFVSGIRVMGEKREYKVFQLETDSLTKNLPVWKVNKQVRIDKVFDTPVYREEPQKSIQVNGEELKLLWGDLHMHSNLSICSLHPKFHCTELEVKHRFSRDVGGLDFNLLTDHQVMDNYEWLQTVKYAHLNDLAGTHVSFVGFEWTSSQLENFHNYGHYNVLYKDEGPLLRIRTGEFDTVEKVCDQLGQTPGMIIPHHPGEGVHPLDWNAFPQSYSPLVEIFQVRGSYEADDCEMPPVNYGRSIKPGNSVQTGLKMGYRFGFTSGGEHEGVGITAVFAKKCTRKAVYEALQKRQTYGTTEPRIFLDYRVNGALMGSEIKVNPGGTLRFTVNVQGTDLIESIHLVSSTGETELWNSPVSKEVTLEMEKTFMQKTEWFYVRVKQTDGHLAWSSPVWVDVS